MPQVIGGIFDQTSFGRKAQPVRLTPTPNAWPDQLGA